MLYWSLSLIDDPRAAIFPRVLIIIMGCLAFLLLIQSIFIRGKGTERPTLQSDRVPNGEGVQKARHPVITVSGCFLVTVVYLAVMEHIGFYTSAFLFFVTIVFLFSPDKLTIRKGIARVGASLIFTAILYVLFNRILVVQTPKGMLF